MNHNFFVIGKFNYSAIRSIVKMPIFVIFKNPDDFPGKYVARVFDFDKPTRICAVRDNYKDIIATLPEFLHRFPRSPGDAACIMESWI